jgi:PAS domain S-box-containing protein
MSRWTRTGRPPSTLAYVVAALAVGGALAARLALDPIFGNGAPFATFLLAVVVAAWFGGFRPALLALGLGWLCADYFFLQPRHAFGIQPTDLVLSVTYLVLGLAIAALNDSMRRAEGAAAGMAEALRESEARLRGMISYATDAIITIDAEQRITVFNTTAESTFGYSADEMMRQPLDRLIPERFRQVHRRHIEGFGLTGVSARAMGGERVLAGLRRNGDEFPMEARISHVEVGGQTLYTVILRDITERKEAETEREELLASAERARAEAERIAAAEHEVREKAEAANQAKDAFLATVSHELRTPLSPILTWVRMLRQERLDADKTLHALDVIERCARTQAQLIEDLLDVSRIVAGKMRLEVRPVMIAAVIEKAVDVVRPAADAKSVRVQVVLDTEVGAILGDAGRLQQVMWNLLSNAIKFTPKGGRVQVALERVHSHIEIAVSDTGQGIEPTFLPYVFERFQQADRGTDRSYGGLGLGLAIVRHIVEAHGGTVHVESPGPGKGTVFTVKLAPMMARRAGEQVRRHPTADRPTDGFPLPRLDGLRLLIVDDEPESNDAVQTLLVSCGAAVRVAGSAQQARDILGVWTPDVLVSDVGMPREDGYALIASLRSRDGEITQIPAVALTAYASLEDKLRLLSSGFQAHVPKPLDPAELVTVIANLARVRVGL